MEAARTILHARDFGARFWAEAVNTVVRVLNRTGTSSIKGVTPFELWYEKRPNIESLRTFGEEVLRRRGSSSTFRKRNAGN